MVRKFPGVEHGVHGVPGVAKCSKISKSLRISTLLPFLRISRGFEIFFLGVSSIFLIQGTPQITNAVLAQKN